MGASSLLLGGYFSLADLLMGVRFPFTERCPLTGGMLESFSRDISGIAFWCPRTSVVRLREVSVRVPSVSWMA